MKIYRGNSERVVVEYDFYEQTGLKSTIPQERIGTLSDGCHTFDELYEFRKMYNAVLFNEWALQTKDGSRYVKGKNKGKLILKHEVHKSWKHHDGELCFGGGWFIVSAMLPSGLISNHYKAEDWDLFNVPEVEKALYEFDGHTSQDVLERLGKL